MSNKKTIDAKILLENLEKLIGSTGDSYGPVLMNRLEDRIDRAINIFNNDLEKLLNNSFKKHSDKMNRCNKIINSKKEVFDEDKNDKPTKKTGTPQFIKTYEKKFGKKI